MSKLKKSKRLFEQILLSFMIAVAQSSALATDLGQNGTDPLQIIPKDQRTRFKDRLDRYVRYKQHNQSGELFKMSDSKTRAAILADRNKADTSKDALKSSPAIKFLEIRLGKIVPLDKNSYSLYLTSTIRKREDNYTEEFQIPCLLVTSFERDDWYFSIFYLLEVHN